MFYQKQPEHQRKKQENTKSVPPAISLSSSVRV